MWNTWYLFIEIQSKHWATESDKLSCSSEFMTHRRCIICKTFDIPLTLCLSLYVALTFYRCVLWSVLSGSPGKSVFRQTQSLSRLSNHPIKPAAQLYLFPPHRDDIWRPPLYSQWPVSTLQNISIKTCFDDHLNGFWVFPSVETTLTNFWCKQSFCSICRPKI